MSTEIPITIEVKYSCPLCGIKGQLVAVPARGDEDLIVWMNDVAIKGVALDHMKRSPNCHPEKLHDLDIPITGVDRVGGPPVN